MIGNGHQKRKEKNSSGELKNEPKLLDEQIVQLIDSGLVEIGLIQ